MSAPTFQTTPLAVLADIASHLAAEGDLASRTRAVLASARGGLGAEECGLWVHGGNGLTCVARVGENATNEAAVCEALERADSTGAGTHAMRLQSGARSLGVFTMRTQLPPGDDARRLFTLIGTLLGSELSHAEHLHLLREEVGQRTRQIDEERRFTQKIIDSLPVGLYVIDSDYRVQAWNRNRETGIQGISRDEAMGKTIFQILHKQPAEKLRKEFDEVFGSGRIQQFNIESSASGERRTFRITKIPMRLNDGAISHVISIGEDITDWTNAQDRFAQSEKLAALGQLAAGIMHEINNPLATIAACAESLVLRFDDMRADGCNVPPQTSEFLQIIDNEVHRCKHIIDGVLEFSRPKSARKASTDINAIIEQTIFLVKHHARFKDIHVHTLLDAETGRVLANADQLVQVFMALLINGVDAMNERGNITIRTRRGLSQAEGVIAEVIDEGHGIARNDLPKIFEPFYTTKPPGRGTGLGLSICYSIIEGHGGRIEVDSAPGAGSTFRVILPSETPAS